MNRFLALALGAVGFLAIFFALGGAGDGAVWVNHYIFIGLYLTATGYAALHEHWLAAAAGVSVTLVRLFIAQGVDGLPFQLVSVVFALLFFLLIVSAVQAGLPARIVPRGSAAPKR